VEARIAKLENRRDPSKQIFSEDIGSCILKTVLENCLNKEKNLQADHCDLEVAKKLVKYGAGPTRTQIPKHSPTTTAPAYSSVAIRQTQNPFLGHRGSALEAPALKGVGVQFVDREQTQTSGEKQTQSFSGISDLHFFSFSGDGSKRSSERSTVHFGDGKQGQTSRTCSQAQTIAGGSGQRSTAGSGDDKQSADKKNVRILECTYPEHSAAQEVEFEEVLEEGENKILVEEEGSEDISEVMEEISEDGNDFEFGSRGSRKAVLDAVPGLKPAYEDLLNENHSQGVRFSYTPYIAHVRASVPDRKTNNVMQILNENARIPVGKPSDFGRMARKAIEIVRSTHPVRLPRNEEVKGPTRKAEGHLRDGGRGNDRIRKPLKDRSPEVQLVFRNELRMSAEEHDNLCVARKKGEGGGDWGGGTGITFHESKTVLKPALKKKEEEASNRFCLEQIVREKGGGIVHIVREKAGNLHFEEIPRNGRQEKHRKQVVKFITYGSVEDPRAKEEEELHRKQAGLIHTHTRTHTRTHTHTHTHTRTHTNVYLYYTYIYV
jgi:hypothetical protein